MRLEAVSLTGVRVPYAYRQYTTKGARAMDVARLLVQVDANTAQAEAGLARMSGKLSAVALGAGVLVVATLAVGVAAAKMAGDFQAGMTTLVTGAGEDAKKIGWIGDALKQMAVDTG